MGNRNRAHCAATLLLLLGLTTPSPASGDCGNGVIFSSTGKCCGDCGNDPGVTVDELTTLIGDLVRIALGQAVASGCVETCVDAGTRITVDVILQAIFGALNNALNGCPSLSDGGEECDDGGICIGSANAGSRCVQEDDCEEGGVCVGGDHWGRACASSEDCGRGECRRCVPFGGDGCAANCTFERTVEFILEYGRTDPTDVIAPTGMVLHGEDITLVSPFSGSLLLSLGGDRDGVRPIAVRDEAVRIPRFPLPTGLPLCGCFRGVAMQTCGGTIFQADGVTPSTVCGDAALHDADPCPPDRPCAFAFGPGNAAIGQISCEPDRQVDVVLTRDCGASPDEPPEASRLIRSRSSAPAGASLLFLSLATSLGEVFPDCSSTFGTLGPDGQLCTADDPPATRGTPHFFAMTTGRLEAEIIHLNDSERRLATSPKSGRGFNCASLEEDGAAFEGGLPQCDASTFADFIWRMSLGSSLALP